MCGRNDKQLSPLFVFKQQINSHPFVEQSSMKVRNQLKRSFRAISAEIMIGMQIRLFLSRCPSIFYDVSPKYAAIIHPTQQQMPLFLVLKKHKSSFSYIHFLNEGAYL